MWLVGGKFRHSGFLGPKSVRSGKNQNLRFLPTDDTTLLNFGEEVIIVATSKFTTNCNRYYVFSTLVETLVREKLNPTFSLAFSIL